MRCDYLRHHKVLQTTDLEVARALADRLWVGHRMESVDPGPFRAATSYAPLAKTGLSFLRWTPVSIQGEYRAQQYLVVLHETGQGVHRINDKTAVATPQQAVLFAPEQRHEITISHCESFALHFQRKLVEHALESRFSRCPPVDEWAREFATDSGPGRTLKSLVRWAALEADLPHSALLHCPKAVAHLERAMCSLLMECLAKLYPATSSGRVAAGPAYIRRVEEWMEANLEEPIGIENLVEVAGVGARTIQAAFRRYRGRSPMTTLQTMRLHRARALLSHPLPGTTVTGVALGIGLLHLGRFSVRYRELFGESPSQTLARGLYAM